MCATDEYAISFFMSVCRNATSEAQTIAMTDSVNTNGVKKCDASGNIGNEKRKKP
jgi:putative methionine-R-sulfoxide reductase with GAF domain